MSSEVTFTMDDLSTSYQPAGKGDGKITGSSSKSDVGPGRSTASNILPTNKHVALHELNQMMNATDFQMQQETHDAAAKAADWLRRLTDDDTLFERNEHIDKLLLAKEVISIKHAESALDEIKATFPQIFDGPNLTVINAAFIHHLSTLLVSSRDDMSLCYSDLGRVLSILTMMTFPEGGMPTNQDFQRAMYALRGYYLCGPPASSHTQPESQSLASTEVMEDNNNMIDSVMQLKASLTSWAAATNNATTTMPPVPDTNVLFKDTLDEITTNLDNFFNQHAADDSANNALLISDDIYSPQ
ncbi:hypothetical protein CGGC5_v000451 [Colletotrichum fructicola Nara gc5]|uniref:Uncharacterized protein n=2 Tax=Colletotrichum fructicola (strain Nara gc5) TaxID=1213859 RepID=A0A7J6JMT5_COLFN|nr:hypothetical protein CGGC5_v000451 [Colletotrichum fructicola Nara gc5]